MSKAFYNIRIENFEDPGNDYYFKTVELTDEEAEQVRNRLLKLVEDEVIYDDYVFEIESSTAVNFTDLDEYLKTQEAARADD